MWGYRAQAIAFEKAGNEEEAAKYFQKQDNLATKANLVKGGESLESLNAIDDDFVGQKRILSAAEKAIFKKIQDSNYDPATHSGVVAGVVVDRVFKPLLKASRAVYVVQMFHDGVAGVKKEYNDDPVGKTKENLLKVIKAAEKIAKNALLKIEQTWFYTIGLHKALVQVKGFAGGDAKTAVNIQGYDTQAETYAKAIGEQQKDAKEAYDNIKSALTYFNALDCTSNLASKQAEAIMQADKVDAAIGKIYTTANGVIGQIKNLTRCGATNNDKNAGAEHILSRVNENNGSLFIQNNHEILGSSAKAKGGLEDFAAVSDGTSNVSVQDQDILDDDVATYTGAVFTFKDKIIAASGGSGNKLKLPDVVNGDGNVKFNGLFPLLGGPLSTGNTAEGNASTLPNYFCNGNGKDKYVRGADNANGGIYAALQAITQGYNAALANKGVAYSNANGYSAPAAVVLNDDDTWALVTEAGTDVANSNCTIGGSTIAKAVKTQDLSVSNVSVEGIYGQANAARANDGNGGFGASMTTVGNKDGGYLLEKGKAIWGRDNTNGVRKMAKWYTQAFLTINAHENIDFADLKTKAITNLKAINATDTKTKVDALRNTTALDTAGEEDLAQVKDLVVGHDLFIKTADLDVYVEKFMNQGQATNAQESSLGGAANLPLHKVSSKAFTGTAENGYAVQTAIMSCSYASESKIKMFQDFWLKNGTAGEQGFERLFLEMAGDT